MKVLEGFLRPTQEGLFKKIQRMFGEKAVAKEGGFLLVLGEVPVLLIAHLDTVHRNPVKTICQSENGKILMSPQGIGGDDRAGVYGICKVYEAAEQKPWLLFACDEEIGGRGAQVFCRAYQTGKLPKELNGLKMLIELDRKGKNDAVYYSCDNPEFEAYVSSKGFKTASGSFSDISIIAPELGIAAANLSCGYYNAHTEHEHINRNHLNATVKKVSEMVSDATKEDFPRYEYREMEWDYGWDSLVGDWDSIHPPRNLPEEYKGIYEELLDLYAPMELEYYRERYGNRCLRELYEYEFCVETEGGKSCRPRNLSA